MKITQLLTAALVKQALSSSALNSLLPDNPSKAEDFFLLPKSYRRAGRARGLLEAAGEEAPLSIQYPMTSRGLIAGGGMLGGGILGGLGGAALHPEAAQLYASGGMLLGGLSGALVDTIIRRREMREAKQLIGGEKDLRASRIKPGERLASLVSGVHQQGRADAAETLEQGRTKFEGNPAMTGLQIAGMVPYVGSLASIPQMVGSVVNNEEARKRMQTA